MGETSKYKFPYPEETDKADVPTHLKLLAESIEKVISDLKIDTIKRSQNFTFYNTGSVLGYNLEGISQENLSKIEIGYVTSETETPTNFVEVTNHNGNIDTDIVEDTIIYIWIKLTYTDIGEFLLNSDNYGNKYSLYMVSGGQACFTGDTKILTETGMKEIKDIKINDNIVTASGIKPVTKKYEHIVSNIYKIKIGNEEIKASYSHPFITERGIVIARDLEVGDILEDITGRKVEIKDIEIIEERAIVYEINTDSNYYYITDSKILVASEVL